MTQLYNLTEFKQRRRILRQNSPSPEILIWGKLRSRQLGGYKFKRQYGIGHFVVDFFCPELKLAVEIDEDSHYQADAMPKDRARQAALERLGIRFLRFTNLDVSSNLEGVLQTIENFINQIEPHPSPLLSKERGQGNGSSPSQGEVR